jgi:hypothetical protein
VPVRRVCRRPGASFVAPHGQANPRSDGRALMPAPRRQRLELGVRGECSGLPGSRRISVSVTARTAEVGCRDALTGALGDPPGSAGPGRVECGDALRRDHPPRGGGRAGLRGAALTGGAPVEEIVARWQQYRAAHAPNYRAECLLSMHFGATARWASTWPSNCASSRPLWRATGPAGFLVNGVRLATPGSPCPT